MSEHTASPDGRIRVYVLGTLHLERRMADGRWEDVPTTSEEWGIGHPTRSFLRYLLAHGRCVGRSTILDTLWTDIDSADRYLYNAASTLRRILRSDEQAPLLETIYNRTTYKLADQSHVWVDVDHCTALLQDVKRIGPTSERGLRLLQEAELLFRRGPLFADEPGDWCFGLREQTKTMQYRCQLWLAEAYEAHQQLAEAEIVVEALLTQDPTDERALRQLMTLLHKQGLTSEAVRRYKQTTAFLKQKGLALSAETEAHVQAMLYTPLMRPASTEHVVPSSSGTLSPVPEHSLLPSHPSAGQGILGAMHMPEREDMDMLRRQLLQQLLQTSVASFASPILRSYYRNSSLDFSKASVPSLGMITQQFRAMQRQGDTLIINGVNTHIQTIQEALEHTVDDHIRHELWKVLAQTQIVAAFNPVKKAGRGYTKTLLETACASAQNSGDVLLTGAALGHLAHFSLREEKNFMKASRLLHQAQEYVQDAHPLHGWFALVMASITSKMGHEQQSAGHLADAMTLVHHLPQTPEYVDLYFTDFSLISASIFTVNCWLTLGNATKAYDQLVEMNLEDLADNRRASAYCDAARACAMMGEFEMAQRYAFQAIDKASSTQQYYVISRCITVAQTMQQKVPETAYAAAITDYARLTLQQQEGESA